MGYNVLSILIWIQKLFKKNFAVLNKSLNEAKLKKLRGMETASEKDGIKSYYQAKIQELSMNIKTKQSNLKRLEAQRNELNTKGSSFLLFSYRIIKYCCKVRKLREEIQLLQEPGSYVGRVVKVMGRKKVLVKVQPDGKYVVDIDKKIPLSKLTTNTRVALRNDDYVLHKILPKSFNALVSLMKVEKVPDSTYDMIGTLSLSFISSFPHLFISSSFHFFIFSSFHLDFQLILFLLY